MSRSNHAQTYCHPKCTHTHTHTFRHTYTFVCGLDIYADLAWQQPIDIAPRSLFILSVLGPLWFTYSLLHSLAANRLWESRLSIIKSSLTDLWQACWIDSSDPLFVFRLPCLPVVWLDPVLCLHEFKVQPPTNLLLVNPPDLSLSRCQTSAADRITRGFGSLLCFLKLSATWQWIMNVSSLGKLGSLFQTHDPICTDWRTHTCTFTLGRCTTKNVPSALDQRNYSIYAHSSSTVNL